MTSIRGLVVMSVLAAALVGCSGPDDPPVAADETETAEEPTTTTEPERDDVDEGPTMPAASGDLDALAESVAATLGRSDVGVAGASLGFFPEWLPAAEDAVVFESGVLLAPSTSAAVGGDDAPVLQSRVEVQYLTTEDADTLQPLYDEAFAAEGWQPAPSGWRTSEDDRARMAKGEFHTAEGYDGPAVEVTVVAFTDEPDVRRVELLHRAELTAAEAAANPEMGDSLSLLQDDLPVPDGFTFSKGAMSIDPFGASVSVETSWNTRVTLDHAELAGEVADALPSGGWTVSGPPEAAGEGLTTVPVARDGWEKERLQVSSLEDAEWTSVTVSAERPLGGPASEGSPAPAPASESGGAGATA